MPRLYGTAHPREGVAYARATSTLHGAVSTYIDCSNRVMFNFSNDEEDGPDGVSNNNCLTEVTAKLGSAEQILGSTVADGTYKEALTGEKSSPADAETHKNKKPCPWQCEPPPRNKSFVIQSEVDSKWRRKAPTYSEIHQASREAGNTMFLAEEAHVFDINDKKQSAKLFNDIGSNVSYIRPEFAAVL